MYKKMFVILFAIFLTSCGRNASFVLEDELSWYLVAEVEYEELPSEELEEYEIFDDEENNFPDETTLTEVTYDDEEENEYESECNAPTPPEPDYVIEHTVESTWEPISPDVQLEPAPDITVSPLARIFNVFNIPPGAEGAFDVSISISAGSDYSSVLSADITLKSDGELTETLLSTEVDAGGFFRGVILPVSVYTARRGDAVETRFFLAEVQLAPETVNNFVPPEVQDLGAMDIRELLRELYVYEIISEYEDFFETRYDEIDGNTHVFMNMTQGHGLLMTLPHFIAREIGTGVADGDVSIEAVFCENGEPLSVTAIASGVLSPPVTVHLVINAIGDAVKIALPTD